MRNYLKNKVDANQKDIVDDIRRMGGKVELLGDPVDLFGWLPGKFWGFIEVKMPGSKAKYTRIQLLWIANTQLPVAIVKSSDEAMDFLQTGHGLTQKQKDAIAGFLLYNPAKFFTPSEIDPLLH